MSSAFNGLIMIPSAKHTEAFVWEVASLASMADHGPVDGSWIGSKDSSKSWVIALEMSNGKPLYQDDMAL